MSLPVAETSPALLMDEESATVVIVHPVVLFHILDHHGRRQEDRVIGTLLGRRDGNRVVEITNCFAVPHAERGDEVAIGKDFNKKMLALHLRTSPKETVVGWYASTADSMIAETTSSLIHEFYAGESEEGDPVHLVVDTRLVNDCLQIKAFKSAPVIIQGEQVGNLFHELKLSLHGSEPETICLHEMIKAKDDTESSVASSQAENGNKVDALQVSMEKLHDLLDTTLQYVNDVVDGKIAPDPEKGRLIADTLATVPRVRPEVFDKLFHNSLQDLLMVTYLSNITRTQIAVAEKLNASLGST